MKIRRTIKEWEIETGVKLKDVKGFTGAKSKIYSKKYTKEEFLLGIQKSELIIRTQKGLDFLSGHNTYDSEQWRSYIRSCEYRKRERKNK